MGTIWWDFDGTLVSRPSMWADAGHRLLATHRPDLATGPEQFAHPLSTGFPWHRPDLGHPELTTPDAWWQQVYRHYASVFAGIGWLTAEADPMMSGIRQHILDAAGYRVFDDVEPVLRQLSQRGWRHIVVSNHVPELAVLLDNLRLSTHFDAVITSAVVGYEKPHSRMFEVARAHTAGDGPIWMVGDNPVADCQAATAFGVNAVLVRTQAGFHRRANDLWGVLDLLHPTERDARS